MCECLGDVPARDAAAARFAEARRVVQRGCGVGAGGIEWLRTLPIVRAALEQKAA